MTFLAIMLGSLLGNGIMLLLAKQLNKIIRPEDRWIHWVGIFICLALVFFLERRYRHMQKIAREEELANATQPEHQESQAEDNKQSPAVTSTHH